MLISELPLKVKISPAKFLRHSSLDEALLRLHDHPKMGIGLGHLEVQSLWESLLELLLLIQRCLGTGSCVSFLPHSGLCLKITSFNASASFPDLFLKLLPQ